VFVLDVSMSMNLFMEKLINEILVVDQAIQALNTPNPPQYGLVVFVDDLECTNNCQPYPDAHATQQALRDWYAFVSTDWFTGNAQLHNPDPNDRNYSWPENSLDALFAAATGFPWRPIEDTVRMIIHSTDDQFWDGPAPTGCAEGWTHYSLGAGTTQNECKTTGSVHTYMEVIDTLRQGGIWVNSFAAYTGGPPTRQQGIMGIYRGNSVDTSMGFFTPYNNQQTIPLSTGGNAWDIEGVNAGTFSLSEGINAAIVEKQGCEVLEFPLRLG
jgi:hypothetical protein